MRIFNRLILPLPLLLLLLLAGPAQAQYGSEPIGVTDLLKIRQLGDVALSPDGRDVAYTVTSMGEKKDAEGEYEYRTHLWLAPSDGRATRPLTRGAHSASQPAWHPDGDRLAFVRTVDSKPQVFVLSLFGGEPYQLTDYEHGASSPRWSPEGDRLLFFSSLPPEAVRKLTGEQPPWPHERPGRTPADTVGAKPDPDGSLAEIRAWLEKNSADGSPRVLNRLDFQGEMDLEPGMTFRHLFVMQAEEGASPKALTRGYYSFGGGSWLPNGEMLIVSGAPVQEEHPDRVRDSDLFLLEADGSAFHRLLNIEGYALSSPLVAPQGRSVAFLARDLDDPGFAQTEIGLFNLDGRSAPEILTAGFDRAVGDPVWSQDSWFLYFTAASDGGFPLYRLPVFEGRPAQPTGGPVTRSASRERYNRADLVLRHPEVERLTSVERGVRSFDVTTGTVAYVLTEVANPYELYVNNADMSGERRASSHNADWLKDKRLSFPEARTVRNDTLQIQYWTMKPAFFEEGKRYPLLLEIHGGPQAMWGPGEATMWHEFQFFAAQGFGLVYANPRGSGGYGHAFKRANYQDWGEGPTADVLAAATEAARQPWADPERQVVTGGSYAGYLTAWIVGHDDRFKAAVAQRGVYDLTTFLGEGNAWRLVPYHFGGYPWEGDSGAAEAPPLEATNGEAAVMPTAAPSPREILIRNSPLTYVEQIRTPLLIIHSDNDLRTGVIQSETLYKSLKILGRPVEYARYPKAGHDLSRAGDPKQRMDRVLRIFEFLARYVGHEPPPRTLRRTLPASERAFQENTPVEAAPEEEVMEEAPMEEAPMEEGGEEAMTMGVPTLGEAFALALGEEALLEGTDGLYVAFEAVEEDSRCPEGAVCVWAGEALVRLRITAPGGEEQTLLLALPGANSGDAEGGAMGFAGYRFRLLDLMPYPQTDAVTLDDEYRARLLVEREG